jgi:hypothetical protein
MAFNKKLPSLGIKPLNGNYESSCQKRTENAHRAEMFFALNAEHSLRLFQFSY